MDKTRKFQKNIYFCFTDYAKTFVWITKNWKILKEMGIPDHLTCLLRNLSAGQEATEPDTKQQTGSKSGKECISAVYCNSVSLTYMRSTSYEMPGWMQHKLESRLPGINIDNLRYADDTTFMAENEEELKSLLMKKRRVKMLA